MYEAVILAAGYSSRVGSNKMILSIDEKPMLCHVVEAFYPLCHKIHVVSGHYHEDIVSLLSHYEKVHIIYNNDYHLGMFSSLLCGIEQVTGDCFICPGDYPLLQTPVIQRLTEVEGQFIVPMFGGKRGHPVLISEALINKLRLEPVESNLKAFRERQNVTYIEVDNECVLVDVDTLNMYHMLKTRKE